MISGIEIEKTKDGSPTLYLTGIDEHYHSVKGALTESSHVYIDLAWRQVTKRQHVTVFEIGFGTGLNAALTAKEALNNKVKTIYYAVELYPLSSEVIGELVPLQNEDLRELFEAVNNANWGEAVIINDCFTIVKIHDNLLTMDIPENLDAVYFDAFAPEKQPEMWDKTVFRKLFGKMTDEAVLTTYCAKGIIRRMLAETGFLVERLPGPPNGKREILRATKPGSLKP